MGLLGFGQADGWALLQKHNTRKKEIWTISLFATKETHTNENLLSPQASCIHSSFNPASHASIYPFST